jgi:PAS domain S-box-containing protein
MLRAERWHWRRFLLAAVFCVLFGFLVLAQARKIAPLTVVMDDNIRNNPAYFQYAGWAALAAVIVLTFLGIWNGALRKRVQAKTATLEEVIAQMRQSEDKYRSTLLNLSIGVAVYDAPERIVLFNQTFLRLFGWDEAHVSDTRWRNERKIVDSDGKRLPKELDPVNIVFATKQPLHDLTIGIEHLSTNETVWVRVDAFPQLWDDGTIRQVVVTFVDSSGRILAEKALAASEEKFSKAFRYSADVIGIATLEDGRFVEVNDTFVNALEYDPEEVLGHTSLEFSLWNDAQQRLRMLQDLQLRRAVKRLEVTWCKKNGDKREGLFSGEVIDIGGVDYILFVWHDITELKTAGEELKQANEELEKKVELRTQDLVRMNQELKRLNREMRENIETLRTTQDQLIQSEKMASLGSLVAGMAHEINTPIGIGVTAASHLQKQVRSFARQFETRTLKRRELVDFLSECDETATITANNLERASQLIQSFKQISTDQSSEERRVFRVKLYLGEILLSLRPRLKNTRHTIRVDCDDEMEIDGYPGAFSQMITNLLMNSLLHAYEETDEGTISIRLALTEDEIYLYYTDDGRGMEPEVADRIFDPFFTTRRGEGGTGLGLYIVYNIVSQQFGGKIQCFSEKGRGTKFVICFPQRKENSDEG